MKTTKSVLCSAQTNVLFKCFVAAILMLFNLNVKAQDVNRIFHFKAGDEFVKEIDIISDGIVERGKQKLSVKTVSKTVKSFLVTDSTAGGYNFKITIKDMDNVIETLGKQLHFNAKKTDDEGSTIQKALRYMVDRPVDLQIDRRGTILTVNDPTEVLASDTLLAFAGIQPEFFERGDLFNLLGDFVYNPLLTKGYTWADSVVIDEQKMVTNYTIEDLTPKTTIIKLKTTSLGKMINSNSTATYILDNQSGLIIEKIIFTMSTGYRVANRVLYATSRSTSIHEVLRPKALPAISPPTAKIKK